jgi:flavin reductase (DIM6/NTAB) family NADH-FMN oxidoreductase RutF
MNAALQSSLDITIGFRAAMRRIAATVTIVTADDGERHHGMTATAVTSLSMEPPSLLVCINKKAFLHGILVRAGNFCVNVLHQDHAELSAAFSGAVPYQDRFDVGRWARSADGLHYLTDAQAVLFCHKARTISYGTHTVFIGEVTQVDVREPVAPLVYQNAGYCVTRPAAEWTNETR